MFARRWSILYAISLLAATATSTFAVEFVVTDGGKPTEKLPAATPAVTVRSNIRPVDATMPGGSTSRGSSTNKMPVELLTPPSAATNYPDPSVPFVDPISPPAKPSVAVSDVAAPDFAVPDVTVPLETEAIQDPADSGRPIPTPSPCQACGEPLGDGSCNCGVGMGLPEMGRVPCDETGCSCDSCGPRGSCGCGTGHFGKSMVGGLGCVTNGLTDGARCAGSLGSGCGSAGGGIFNDGNCLSSSGSGADDTGWFLNLWLAQGFTYNENDPASGSNFPLTFNDRSDKYLLNQIYLSFGRAVSTSSWDLGGRIDLLYGTDYFFTTALGLETRQDGSPHWNSSDGPRGTGAALYGLAMPQAYVELGVPFANGTSVKFGHFYTILGYESVMAPENFFYSHAYMMQYGQPFTHTGMLADVSLNDSLSLLGGVTLGWDNWDNPNGKAGYLAGISWCPTSESSIAFSLAGGREDANANQDRTLYTIVYTRQMNSRLQYVIEHDFGTEGLAELDTNFNQDSAKWYGISQYLYYEASDTLTLGARVEWFRDQDNARVLGIPSETLVDGGNYYELTLGANYRPNCRWIFRPEIRWDYSDVAATGLGSQGMFDDFTKDNQLTLAGDLIFRF